MLEEQSALKRLYPYPSQSARLNRSGLGPTRHGTSLKMEGDQHLFTLPSTETSQLCLAFNDPEMFIGLVLQPDYAPLPSQPSPWVWGRAGGGTLFEKGGEVE
ncbi:hypothetical protein TNCV_2079121 [Trichonephila clavipes]|nr:hypothetical protein TNCV_2079121 [Trichonephila clavipes]